MISIIGVKNLSVLEIIIKYWMRLSVVLRIIKAEQDNASRDNRSRLLTSIIKAHLTLNDFPERLRTVSNCTNPDKNLLIVVHLTYLFLRRSKQNRFLFSPEMTYSVDWKRMS